MAVFKLDKYYPYYREVFNGNDIMDFVVYAQGNDRVGRALLLRLE